jgi:hypothetical protein
VFFSSLPPDQVLGLLRLGLEADIDGDVASALDKSRTKLICDFPVPEGRWESVTAQRAHLLELSSRIAQLQSRLMSRIATL